MIRVRQAVISDAPGVARIDVETWRAAYAGILPDHMLVRLSERQRGQLWSNFIRHRADDMVVAQEDERAIVGFGSCGPQRDRGIDFAGEVFTLYVTPDFQGRGIGRDLLLALFGRLVRHGFSSALIWVLRDNPARFFYERVGGRRALHRKIIVGGQPVDAIAYGWTDLPAVLQQGGRAASRLAGDEPRAS